MDLRIKALLGLALAAAGCGPSQQVTVGDPHADPGVIRHDIDVAQGVQTAANQRVHDNDAEIAKE
ncbi:MAG: hypothetical protein M9921_04260 [Fimbriimonadaceae bacterium]|nr:hypothetical protein [Chthonomonadaceae bacterium]MCO5296049.1 hypothetical protein [Fimbriimonadaceae bacterium]